MRTHAALLGLTALLALSGSAFADNRMRLIDEENDLYQATFEGGTLEEFIDMLKDGLEDRVMFITPARADEISMPAFDIANVEFPQVIALSGMIANVPTVRVDPESWSGPFDNGIGAPVIIFNTQRVFAPEMQSQLSRPKVSFEFQGGTVSEYVKVLNRSGADGRVVVIGDADSLQMQPISLRDVTLESAVWILDGVERSEGMRAHRIDVEDLDNVYRVHVQSLTRRAAADSRVWSLRAMTAQGIEADTLLGAIEAGLDTLNSDAKPNLRYHEPTALLIAVGDDTSLGLIEAIIEGLDRSAAVEANTVTPLERMRQQHDSLQREYERLTVHSRTIEERLTELVQKIDMHTRLISDAEQAGDGRAAAVAINDMTRLESEAAALHADNSDIETRMDNVRMLTAQLGSLIQSVVEGESQPLEQHVLMNEFGIPSTRGVPGGRGR